MNCPKWKVLLFCLASHKVAVQAFQSTPNVAFRSTFRGRNVPTAISASKRTLVKDRKVFDPMGFAEESRDEADLSRWNEACKNSRDSLTEARALALASAALVVQPQGALAAEKLTYDPSSFVPVCPTSDGFYRFLKGSTQAIVGPESFQEYGPLIAGGLLRVRLELCVVESFFQEAVGPFIAKNGLSWILPLHETVETFLAGTVFAFAATFILIGSTKIITITATYADLLLGLPSRLFGGFFYDRALGKPVTLDIGLGPFKTRLVGPPAEEEEAKVDIMQKNPGAILVIAVSFVIKLFGQIMRIIREVCDGLDTFVGRYLVVWATGYVLIKFLHFKVFPDFPNFF
eukprot:CAMPEP_0198139316 /NCGR_PEP_ID=MMETSP1443-20131203/2643_1 /TAXON_ID=186043 /ORGANISM="Entomoneis sp., Strain CCMP2396" /LENGTH=344 /DNA_ID=CAMNT_0043801421 /DNA_START=144 /DNA_END=1178 /DNA_ORIENTATION=+